MAVYKLTHGCLQTYPWLFTNLPMAVFTVRYKHHGFSAIFSTIHSTVELNWNGDVAQLVTATDRHAADAGSIP